MDYSKAAAAAAATTTKAPTAEKNPATSFHLLSSSDKATAAGQIYLLIKLPSTI